MALQLTTLLLLWRYSSQRCYCCGVATHNVAIAVALQLTTLLLLWRCCCNSDGAIARNATVAAVLVLQRCCCCYRDVAALTAMALQLITLLLQQ